MDCSSASTPTRLSSTSASFLVLCLDLPFILSGMSWTKSFWVTSLSSLECLLVSIVSKIFTTVSFCVSCGFFVGEYDSASKTQHLPTKSHRYNSSNGRWQRCCSMLSTTAMLLSSLCGCTILDCRLWLSDSRPLPGSGLDAF